MSKTAITQRKIAVLTAFFAYTAFMVNLFVGIFLRNLPLRVLMPNPVVWSPLAAALLFFSTRKIDRSIIRILHFTTVVVVALAAIWDEYDSYYGLGLIILAVVIGFKYGYFNSGIFWKIPLMIIMVITTIELSARVKTHDDPGAGLGVAAFLVFFTGFFYVMYKEEIDTLSSENEGLITDLIKARRESIRLKKAVEVNRLELEKFRDQALKAEISEEERWLSLRKEFRLTSKELSVVQEVFTIGGTNAEIAESMGVSECTIKKHLNTILEKMESRNRLDLVVLTREYIGI